MKIKSFTLLLFIVTSGIYGQLLTSPKIMLSPNISNVGLYGEILVSHFTSTPIIQVSLQELQMGNLHLPFSLSYHTTSICPDKHSG